MSRKTALVICPGRGTYNKTELGYLAKYHGGKAALINTFDDKRRATGQKTLSELDGADHFLASEYTRGDNASALIYACAYADYLSIDRDAIEIVAITGNSMGWYIALTCAGVLNAGAGFDVVNTMGNLMQQSLIGGQLIYPYVDENWVEINGQRARLEALAGEIPNLFISIRLGGLIVFAGDEAALGAVEQHLPPVHEGRFPLRLKNHAGFHSPLQLPNSRAGKAALPASLFTQPHTPLIDGRGAIWRPKAVKTDEIAEYTLGHQVIKPYDFSAAVRVGLKEFAPYIVIITGPGNTLEGSVAQCLISEKWNGLASKKDFIERQKTNPVVVAMGTQTQRITVT